MALHKGLVLLYNLFEEEKASKKTFASLEAKERTGEATPKAKRCNL
ncbi:hypothetical protein [Flavobacterium psychrophilum]|nr:hypothetical protein [Flavobacterium psychrophilum]MCB6098846.1 hypothetical protein [Flavobacterium psychrophilum]